MWDHAPTSGSSVAIRKGLPPSYQLRDRELLRAAVAQIASTMGWNSEVGGPFGRIVQKGTRVLLKPNWVLHANQGPWGLEPLITHQHVIMAVTEAVLEADVAAVTIADAPIQGCDFDFLIRETGLADWATGLSRRDPRFTGLADLRRTVRTQEAGEERTLEGVKPADRFVLYDLGPDSLLEPITTPKRQFRVTQYHPEHLGRTHAPGKHQYLVAREVPEADLIINLPKLKTHKKAGVTCALKNLVGINGNKEYLPHHRVGSPTEGGDCYPESSRVKRALEWAFDRYNSATSLTARQLWQQGIRVLQAIQHRRGDQIGIEGSWSGNDTVWRMCLDLNRILLYGQPDGTLDDRQARQTIHIVDALVAGQGDGPLKSEPLPMGILLGGESAAAVDWVCAQLLGFDPAQIPIVQHAFDRFRWPLTGFLPDGVASVDAETGADLDTRAINQLTPDSISYPAGWLNAVRAPR